MASLRVKVNGALAGALYKEQGKHFFRYDMAQQLTNFVSLTMPVRRSEYQHSQLFPIFEMHLPEGYLLALLKRHYAKLVGSDDFNLLGLMAPSIRGRLEYSAESTPAEPLSLEELVRPQHKDLFQELAERFALHSPISGVQPKVLAPVLNKATLKLEQYIVKAWGEEYPQLALNEYWCMRVAQAAGIPVPEFYLSDDKALFIMKRFDFLPTGEALGFEDFCVLQGKSSEQKYEGTYEQLAKSLLQFLSAQSKHIAMQYFFKMMVVNQILQNGDAHLKNFGVLYTHQHDVTLAPAYDIVSTTAYIRNDSSALLMMGSNKWWTKKHLLQFGIHACQLSAEQAERSYQECIFGLQAVHDELQQTIANSKNEDELMVMQHIYCLIEKELKQQ